jgi:hexosaminidase
VTGLIPAPVRIDPLDGDGVTLDGRATVQADPGLSAVVEAFRLNLLAHTGIEVLDASPGSDPNIALRLIEPDADFGGVSLAVGLNPRGEGTADERYRLLVESGSIRLEAVTEEGIFRGLTTLSQLIRLAVEARGGSSGGHQKGVVLPAQRILDGPRISWRGLSLDVVRTFFTVENVKSVIDLLAMYKMNVLHLHLSDNEGWRLEITSWPQLTTVGGRGARGDRPGGYYTQADYREIVRYAKERFITVVPEIDVPGHTAAIFTAYPQLGGGDQGADTVPMTYLDPRRESTFAFLQDVLGELAALTPGGYLHVGGDEAFGMPEDLYVQFLDRALAIARSFGKRVVGWQEISRGAVQPGDVIQYWISFDPDEVFGSEGLAASLGMPAETMAAMKAVFSHAKGDAERADAKGVSVVLSPSSVAYLDTPYAEAGDPEQESDRQRLGLRAYQPLNVEESTRWDPATVIDAVDFRTVGGLEAAIWCETVESVSDLQFLLLPRLPGFAEKGWSAPGSLEWDEYRARLAAQAPLWRTVGWNYFRSSLVDWR